MPAAAKAYIAGIFEHPTRKAEGKSLAQLHAEVARGALADAGLSKSDVDGYFCAGDVAGWERPGPARFPSSIISASSCVTSTRPNPGAPPISCTSPTPLRRSPRASATSR